MNLQAGNYAAGSPVPTATANALAHLNHKDNGGYDPQSEYDIQTAIVDLGYDGSVRNGNGLNGRLPNGTLSTKPNGIGVSVQSKYQGNFQIAKPDQTGSRNDENNSGRIPNGSAGGSTFKSPYVVPFSTGGSVGYETLRAIDRTNHYVRRKLDTVSEAGSPQSVNRSLYSKQSDSRNSSRPASAHDHLDAKLSTTTSDYAKPERRKHVSDSNMSARDQNWLVARSSVDLRTADLYSHASNGSTRSKTNSKHLSSRSTTSLHSLDSLIRQKKYSEHLLPDGKYGDSYNRSLSPESGQISVDAQYESSYLTAAPKPFPRSPDSLRLSGVARLLNNRQQLHATSELDRSRHNGHALAFASLQNQPIYQSEELKLPADSAVRSIEPLSNRRIQESPPVNSSNQESTAIRRSQNDVRMSHRSDPNDTVEKSTVPSNRAIFKPMNDGENSPHASSGFPSPPNPHFISTVM